MNCILLICFQETILVSRFKMDDVASLYLQHEGRYPAVRGLSREDLEIIMRDLGNYFLSIP